MGIHWLVELRVNRNLEKIFPGFKVRIAPVKEVEKSEILWWKSGTGNFCLSCTNNNFKKVKGIVRANLYDIKEVYRFDNFYIIVLSKFRDTINALDVTAKKISCG